MDLIVAEIEKLSKILAKILGLKAEGNTEELNLLAENTLNEELDLPRNPYTENLEENYESHLISQNYSPDKLDLLAKILIESASASNNSSDRNYKYRQVLVIYDILEKVHHTQSLQNLTARSEIEKLLT